MKVKICGITNLEDALVAAEVGADYLGFILYPPSPRAVDKATVKSIIAHLRQHLARPPLMVGVFVNETAVTISQTLDECGLDLAQLSGEEVPALAGGLNPDNVAAAITQLKPFAVDVASGVEAAPGQKDHAKMRAFIANARLSNAH